MVPEGWQERLRSGGHRITPQRESILMAVAALEHPTPEAILSHLKPREPALNLSTVYRNLAVLQEVDLVTHSHIGTGSPVYHLVADLDHIHLSCLSCGSVFSVPAATAAEFAAAVETRTGFVVDPTHAAVYGLCSACREQVTG